MWYEDIYSGCYYEFFGDVNMHEKYKKSDIFLNTKGNFKLNTDNSRTEKTECGQG